MLEEIQKIDSHQHLWDLSKIKWSIDQIPEPYKPICRDYLLEDYLKDMEESNIVKSVAVEAHWHFSQPMGDLEEVSWLQSIADTHGFPHGIVGYANFKNPNVEKILKKYINFANMRGIRQNLNWNENPEFSGCDKNYIEDDKWQNNLALLEKYNLSFDMLIFPEQMATAHLIVQRYPNILFILDHAGMPIFRKKDDFDFWKKQLELLANNSNVVIKISGLAMFDPKLEVSFSKKILLTVIDIFGIDRCMYGTNFPVDKLYVSGKKLSLAWREITKHLSEIDKKKLFYDNASRIYRI